jgi:hypothetical protein
MVKLVEVVRARVSMEVRKGRSDSHSCPGECRQRGKSEWENKLSEQMGTHQLERADGGTR